METKGTLIAMDGIVSEDHNAPFRSLAERLGHGLVLLDQTGVVQWCNAAFAALSGRGTDSAIGTKFPEMFDAPDQGRIHGALERALIDGSTVTCHARLVTDHGGLRCAAMEVSENGPGSGMFAVMVRDVSGEIQLASAVHALAETPPRCAMAELIATTGLALGMRLVALARRDTVERDHFTVSDVAVRGRRHVGVPEPDSVAVDRVLASLVPPGAVVASRHMMRAESRQNGECVITVPLSGPNGMLSGVLVCLNPAPPENLRDAEKVLMLFAQRIAAEIAADDLESRLLQSRESETLRHLARGVAHEFNNILMRVSGNFQLLQRRVPPDLSLERYIDAGLAAVAHGAGIVKEIEDFSAERSLELSPLPLGPVLRRAGKLWTKSIPEGVTFGVNVEEDCLVMGCQAALLELIGQLLRNSIEAIEGARRNDADGHGGEHRITLALSHYLHDRGQQTACVSVTDTGIGMNERDVARVFDPFFTTKDPGKGTGLGLAIAQSIAFRHQGRVEVSSAPGRGTRFELKIPLIRVVEAEPEE
jgi:PAS domain S-box-containing protein